MKEREEFKKIGYKISYIYKILKELYHKKYVDDIELEKWENLVMSLILENKEQFYKMTYYINNLKEK